MKVRNGFVSNSSSSSFCIYGASFEFEELLEKAKSYFSEDELKEIEEEPYLLEEMLIEKTNLAVYSSDDNYWIGKSWTNVGDDQTGKEFKDSIKEELEKILGPDIECGTHEEEIYS
jgi:hypothetical protein